MTEILSYLQKMQEIGDAATKGPWEYVGADRFIYDGQTFVQEKENGTMLIIGSYKQHAHGIGEFIATSRNEWNKLLEMNSVLLAAMELIFTVEAYAPIAYKSEARTALDAVSKIVEGK